MHCTVYWIWILHCQLVAYNVFKAGMVASVSSYDVPEERDQPYVQCGRNWESARQEVEFRNGCWLLNMQNASTTLSVIWCDGRYVRLSGDYSFRRINWMNHFNLNITVSGPQPFNPYYPVSRRSKAAYLADLILLAMVLQLILSSLLRMLRCGSQVEDSSELLSLSGHIPAQLELPRGQLTLPSIGL